MSTRTDRVISVYLERLEKLLAPLPRARREQLLEEIAEHIADAREGLDPDDEIGLLDVLEALGDPEVIADEALPAASSSANAWRVDRFVPLLVLLGGFVFGIGWLVGIILLWSSTTWRRRDKLLATFVVPGGLLFPVLLSGIGGARTACTRSGGVGLPTVTHCTTNGFVLPLPFGIALLLVAILGPLLVALHLDRVRRAVLAR